MLQTLYFRSLFFLIIAIAITHVASVKYFWYWFYPWMDLVVHFFGGFWIALLVIWLIFFSGYFHVPQQGYRAFFYTALLSTLVVSVGWEFFEFHFNIISAPDNYGRDTVSDTVLGLIGAVVASLYTYRGYPREGN